MLQRVVVTGLGAVTPLGIGVKRTWQRLINADSGIVSTRPLGPEFEAIPSQVAGLVPRGKKDDEGWTSEEWVTATELKQSSTFTHYALAATHEALHHAGLTSHPTYPIPKPNSPLLTSSIDPTRIGITLGTGIGALSTLHTTSSLYSSSPTPNSAYKSIHPLFVPRLLPNLGAGHISLRYGLAGPSHCASTACTTGAHSIGDAMRMIMLGDADVMVAGGSESCIHPLAVGGFARSRSLATAWNENPRSASRPFDADRGGFVIAEGCGILVLESLDHAKARAAPILAELVGYGLSSDANHITTPPHDGNGALRAMRRALETAGLAPAHVDYINAHATSTLLGDAAENRAIKALMLGDHGRASAREVNVSSTKGAVGHLLGAAGGFEALVCIKSIVEGVMPPTLNLESVGEEFDCNYAAGEAQRREIRVALTNSFGFGGTNASLCFRRFEG